MQQTDFEFLDEFSSPLDTVEYYFVSLGWHCQRISPDRFVIELEGHWRNFVTVFEWAAAKRTLIVNTSFEIPVIEGGMLRLLEAINAANWQLETGCFLLKANEKVCALKRTYWVEEGEQLDGHYVQNIVHSSVLQCDMIFPVFLSAAHGDADIESVLDLACAEPAGAC